MAEKLFDVVEVEIAAPHKERIIAERKTERNADAIVSMAVMRRGCETHFFKTVGRPTQEDTHE